MSYMQDTKNKMQRMAPAFFPVPPARDRMHLNMETWIAYISGWTGFGRLSKIWPIHPQTDSATDSHSMLFNMAYTSQPLRLARRCPLGRSAYKMLNLQRFGRTNNRLSELAYDVSLAFYQDQRNTMAHFTKTTQHILPDLRQDVSGPRLWELQRSFADNVIKWLSLFSLETVPGYLAPREASNYSEHLPSTCICFLIFAVVPWPQSKPPTSNRRSTFQPLRTIPEQLRCFKPSYQQIRV